MSEISAYEAQVKKMQGLCEEHNLVYRFHKERYPMTFTIKPSCTMDAQISMLESVEDEGYISPAASMTWIFNDGVLETKVRGGTFTISKTTRTKIENILIKMITFWQQYFFRSVIENQLIPERRMPVIDDEALWPEDAESFGDDDEGDGISGSMRNPRTGKKILTAIPAAGPGTALLTMATSCLIVILLTVRTAHLWTLMTRKSKKLHALSVPQTKHPVRCCKGRWASSPRKRPA